MRKILLIIVALAVVVVGIFFALDNPLGKLVKLAIEEFAPKMTQTDVRVGNVKISATNGQGEISGLFLGNPKGFKTDYAFKVSTIEIGIEPTSLNFS